MFNGTALNGATLNGSGGTRVQVAYAAVDALSNVSAAAWAKRKGEAPPLQGYAEISWDDNSVIQRHSTRATINAIASMIAAVPKIRHASAAVVVSMGETSVSPFAFRKGDADIVSVASVNDGYVYVDRIGGSSTACLALVTGTAFGKMYPNSQVSCEAKLSGVAVRRCPSLSTVSVKADVSAIGGYSIAAQSALNCRAVVSATAGYGIPSLSVLSCRAGMYVYARQTIKSGATIAGKANTAAVSIGGFGGVSSALCRASVTATAISEQGQCDDLTARASVSAEAEYWHSAKSNMAGVNLLTGQAIIDHCGQAAMSGKAVTRVETKVNNQLEGYGDPAAISVLGINVNGVAVAMTIGHIHAYVDVSSVGTYQHMAKSSALANCATSSDGTLVHLGVADISSGTSLNADGHWEWYGASSVAAKCDAEGYGNILHLVDDLDVTARATVTPYPTYQHSAKSSCIAVSLLTDGDVSINRGGFADILCTARCGVEAIGNPDARDPLERTMYRAYVDRMMVRPFMDRVMTTTSA